MNVIISITKKELFDYFNSSIAYIYVLIFLITSHIYFFKHLFIFNQASMISFFTFAPYFFLFLIPAISMRVWSEEKKSGTLAFLFTLPIKEYQLILGKYIASLIFLLFIIISTLPFAFVVFYLGNPEILTILTSYIALFMLGACFLSIGFLMSSLTKNQIVSFLLTAILSVIFYFLNTPLIIYSLPSFFTPILNYCSLEFHFFNLVNGLISLQSIIYFSSFITCFLFLNNYIFTIRTYLK